MKQVSINDMLQKERDKLSRFVDNALDKGASIAQDEAIIKQNRKVDTLIVKMQKEKERHGKKEQER